MSTRIVYILVFIIFLPGTSLSAAGDLDPTFGGDGIVTYSGIGEAVTMQQDGKIVISGESWNGSNWDVFVLRYNNDGTLDTSFGEDGVVTYDGGNDDYGVAIALQQDGKIVVAGGSWYDLDLYNVLVLRYNIDGSLDSTFAGNGFAIYRVGFSSFGYGVAIQSDGKIVIAGIGNSPADDVLVLRYNNEGTLDTSFGEDGVVTYDGGNDDYGVAIALQQDGKIVVAGFNREVLGVDWNILMLKYNVDGTLDTAFGKDGVVKYDTGGYVDDYGEDVVIQLDGKIVVTGESLLMGTYAALFLRYENSGTLDITFGKDGVVTYDSDGDDYGIAVAMQQDQKIVVVGYSSYNVLVLRYKRDGTLDGTFSGDGVVLYDSGGPDFGKGVALQIDGKIVVTGTNTLRLIGGPLALISPNGGEHIPSGSNYSIQWWGVPAEAVKFKLIYSLDNGLTWFPIPKTADFITATSYDWTVPTPWDNKRQCLVKVIEYDSSGTKIGADKSDAPFSIEVVSVTSPAKGETLLANNPYTIRWTTNATKRPALKVKLYYTKDGGTTWNKITRIYGNPGSYDWQVPCVMKDKASCKVKVILLDASGNILGEDVSNGYFTIARTCTDISGNWYGIKKYTQNCEYNGQSESDKFITSVNIFINQNDCKINWTPAAWEKSSGIIWCDKLRVSGKFCWEVFGTIYTTNYVTEYGTVTGDTINLNGWWQCSGTDRWGMNFSCYGETNLFLYGHSFE